MAKIVSVAQEPALQRVALRCVAGAGAGTKQMAMSPKLRANFLHVVIAARSRPNLFKDVTTLGFRSLVTSLKEFDNGTGDLGH